VHGLLILAELCAGVAGGKTVLDKSVEKFQTIFISGGKRGLDIEVKPQDLEKLLNAKSYTIAN
jgi:prolyl-tRNA editing enzyme YbaK/EbsC (Cys-tRNA(Pro) deacylase)